MPRIADFLIPAAQDDFSAPWGSGQGEPQKGGRERGRDIVQWVEEGPLPDLGHQESQSGIVVGNRVFADVIT